jgi:hypothetical protein
MEQRHKRRTIIAVAAARELAGFCSAAARAFAQSIRDTPMGNRSNRHRAGDTRR